MFTKWPIVPPQNWHYFEGETKVDGETFEQLSDNLASYRAANHLPAGDPKGEIEKFVAARWPHVLGLKEAPPDPDEPRKIYGKQERRKLAERVGSWCATRFSRIGSLGFVEPEIALQRANTCIGCEFNRANWKNETIQACPGCRDNVESVEVLAYKIRRGRTVPREGKVGACDVLGQDSQVAIHLNADGLRHVKHYREFLPSHCWCLSLPSIDTLTASAQPTAK